MLNDIKAIVAKNIASLRKINGITQLELAEKLNYSDKAVSKWERGESLPDVMVLKEIAETFGVSADYMLTLEHKKQTNNSSSKRNKKFVSMISVVMVWLVATIIFISLELVPKNFEVHWLAFVFACPVSLTVWLIFNSIWFNRRFNFTIISLLLWSVLAVFYVTFAAFGVTDLWPVFFLGIPGQLIIGLWSGIKTDKTKKK